MQHREGNYTGLKDLELYYQAWLPEGDPLAVPDQVSQICPPVLIMHGTVDQLCDPQGSQWYMRP